MGERKAELDAAGVTVIGVASRDDHQARHLMETGVPFELLLDPADQLRTLLGIGGRFSRWRLLHPRGAVGYLRSMRQARRFDPIWAEATQRPAMLLFDHDLEIVWSHAGRSIADYPAVETVLERIESISRHH